METCGQYVSNCGYEWKGIKEEPNQTWYWVDREKVEVKKQSGRGGIVKMGRRI